MRVAAIDLGTNTFLLLVADVANGKIEKVLHDEARVVRLGQGVHQTRRLHPEALARADECLKDFATTLKKHGSERIIACATSAARDVQNKDELLMIGRKHGIEIQVISGDREAECTFRGTVGKNLTEPVGIIDVGGGSTEFMIGDATGIKKKISIDIGSVRLTELFITKHPVPQAELAKVNSYIEEKLKPLGAAFQNLKAKRMIAVAGTPTTLAAMDLGKPFDAQIVHGYKLPLQTLESWTQRLAKMTIEERQHISGMDPKRADVIVAGAAILTQSCKAMQASELEVSTQGLRYGLALLEGSGR